MSCTQPPALTDDTLSAVLDGEAPIGAAEHLAICPECAARLERARRGEQALKTVLYRWDCPSAHRLGEAELGLLPESETRAIQQHLLTCHACAAEVDELRHFLADTTLVPDEGETQDRLRPGVVRALVGLAAAVSPREMAIAVRGTGIGPLVATAPGITLVLDPQPVSPGRVLVLGQVAADEQERWTGALVELRQADRVQALATVDELGSFRCGPVATGQADLRITPEHGQPVLLADLSLGEHDT